MDFDHGAAVEAVILGGVAKAADASLGEAVDLWSGGVVAVARGGVVHEEFFAVDEAELVAVAGGEDFIEGDMVVDGARVGGYILGGGGLIVSGVVATELESTIIGACDGLVARIAVGVIVCAVDA